jgi:ribosomal protein S18 acetylase RimI-like enzyme
VTELRPAGRDDIVLLSALAREAYAKYVPLIGREPAPMNTDYARHVDAGEVVVAVEQAQLVGFLMLTVQADRLQVNNLAVRPQAQGRGVGRLLLDHAETRAAELDLSALTLYTNVAMLDNLALYAHLGYTETHRAEQDGFHRVFLRKDLS